MKIYRSPCRVKEQQQLITRPYFQNTATIRFNPYLGRATMVHHYHPVRDLKIRQQLQQPLHPHNETAQFYHHPSSYKTYQNSNQQQYYQYYQKQQNKPPSFKENIPLPQPPSQLPTTSMRSQQSPQQNYLTFSAPQPPQPQQ